MKHENYIDTLFTYDNLLRLWLLIDTVREIQLIIISAVQNASRDCLVDGLVIIGGLVVWTATFRLIQCICMCDLKTAFETFSDKECSNTQYL